MVLFSFFFFFQVVVTERTDLGIVKKIKELMDSPVAICGGEQVWGSMVVSSTQ